MTGYRDDAVCYGCNGTGYRESGASQRSGRELAAKRDVEAVEQRRRVARRFRQTYGDATGELLEELRRREYSRYLKAIRSIENGRGGDVAHALWQWARSGGIVG